MSEQSFSQRMGIKPVKAELQLESMDADLRNGLWNSFHLLFLASAPFRVSENSRFEWLMQTFWKDFFKLPVDTIPYRSAKAIAHIRKYVMYGDWSDVYDFIQFVAEYGDIGRPHEKFIAVCNGVLKRELSGYRFVSHLLVQITSEAEQAEIEKALNLEGPLVPISLHISQALEHLGDREKPDYRNSIKESISAVEAAAKIVSGLDKATLTQALNKIEEAGEMELHPDLKQGFTNLYRWTSDDEGIRHSLKDKPTLDYEDASYMLSTCSAFANYLVVKAEKAGIEF